MGIDKDLDQRHYLYYDGIRWTDIKARFESSRCKEICRISANSRPKSCSELTNMGSGAHDIYVDGSRVKVYCDMSLSKDGGGWTVIQRRGHFGTTENFYRGWNDYRNGFGDPYKDHWLGLKYQNLITQAQAQQLLITLEDWDGNSIQYTVNNYKISNEANKFKMDYSTMSPDSTSWSYHKGKKFSTKDQDNDEWSGGDCAVGNKGAWWYNSCSYSNLNGLYGSRGSSGWKYIVWYHWKVNGNYKKEESLKKTEMKIRPMSYQASGSTNTGACLRCILDL